MKGISPIIATILLIVMTVAIAGLMYAWLMGLFSSLTTASSNQASQATQIVSFTVPQVYPTNSSSSACSSSTSCNITAIIYNNGNVPIVPSLMSVVGMEYYTANQTFDGTTVFCNVTSYNTNPITYGSQAQWVLNCTNINITELNEGTAYYVFTFTYRGVSVQATLT